MKKKPLNFLFLTLVIFLFPLNFLRAQAIDFEWNTFLGSSNADYGSGIVVDDSGNIYITGNSYNTTWGSPINAHSGGYDSIVACLDNNGNLIWNTFLGCASADVGNAITLDSSGNIYVAGGSAATWGSPVNAHSGGNDVFVACLNGSGTLLWNTFLGSSNDDHGYGLDLDSSGNIYLTGRSSHTWGAPLNAHSGSDDAFIARLNSSGTLLWNTFLGCSSSDSGNGISLTSTGSIYLTGWSASTWGSPLNAHSGGGADAFVAGLDNSGNLLWNTFLGSGNIDIGCGIALNNSGVIYTTGRSNNTWGSPVNAHSGSWDAFAACLNSSGSLIWNTFMGSSNSEYGLAIGLNNAGKIYVTGWSDATWDSPENPYYWAEDMFIACLDSSGNLDWNTFHGSYLDDSGNAIAVDNSGDLYVTGESGDTWGSPVSIHNGGFDAFVLKITFPPDPDITANGSDGPISITESDTLQIRVSLDSNGSTSDVDFWLAYKGPAGWIHYDKTSKSWEPGLGVSYQGSLFDINNKKVFQKSGLTPGEYTFYFGVDLDMNGKITKSSLYKDEVQVTVTSN
jgi:hypothetical protein